LTIWVENKFQRSVTGVKQHLWGLRVQRPLLAVTVLKTQGLCTFIRAPATRPRLEAACRVPNMGRIEADE